MIQLEKTTLTTREIIDFTKLDLSDVNENLRIYIGGSEVLDENNNVLYEKLINVYTQIGFTCK